MGQCAADPLPQRKVEIKRSDFGRRARVNEVRNVAAREPGTGVLTHSRPEKRSNGEIIVARLDELTLEDLKNICK